MRNSRVHETPITRQCNGIFTDQSIFRYFSREIGQFQSTWARFLRIKQCGLTWTCRHHVDMSTLVRACDCNWSLRFLWKSEFEINSKYKNGSVCENAVTGIRGSCRLLRPPSDGLLDELINGTFENACVKCPGSPRVTQMPSPLAAIKLPMPHPRD